MADPDADWLAGGDDDGGDDWLSAGADDTPAAPSSGGATASAADTPVIEKVRPDPWLWPQGQPFLRLPPYRTRRVQPRKLDKFIPFTHWSRPMSLNYEYIYLYRKNYYDDVIDYLDKRSRGINRDLPRPQTWAERALRTYNSMPPPRMQKTPIAEDCLKNVGLTAGLTHTKAIRHHHSNSVIRSRYYGALFTPLSGPQAPDDVEVVAEEQ